MVIFSIEQEFWSDVRRFVLADLLKIHAFEATGRITSLWRYCFEHKKVYLKPGLIDLICEKEGFEDALVKAGLGEVVGDYIKVKGVESRLS
jgi:hypothetical protein